VAGIGVFVAVAAGAVVAVAVAVGGAPVVGVAVFDAVVAVGVAVLGGELQVPFELHIWPATQQFSVFPSALTHTA
jgi:hypothetical protein